MTPPLVLEGVRFGYRKTPVFSDLNLSLSAAGLTAILGPNGCGKTTLVRLATGLLRPERGTVLLFGDPVRGLSPRERARRVAVVPQENGGTFPFSVLETVLMGRTPWTSGFGFETREDLAVAREALLAVGALDLAERSLSELSGGERQKVLLARALAQRTRFLLLDEPTSHLDLRHQTEIFRLLGGLAREGLTVVAISHDVNLAARFADRLVLLARGSVRAAGTPEEVLTPKVLEEVYETQVAVRRVPGLTVPQVFPR